MQEDIVEQNKEIISVGELNRSAKYLLEDNFSNVSVIVRYQIFLDLAQVMFISH